MAAKRSACRTSCGANRGPALELLRSPGWVNYAIATDLINGVVMTDTEELP